LPGNPLGLARDEIIIEQKQLDAHGASVRQYGITVIVLESMSQAPSAAISPRRGKRK